MSSNPLLRTFRSLIAVAFFSVLSVAAQQTTQPPAQQSAQPAAQQPVAKSDQTIKVNVKVVNLLVTVRNKDGKFVNNLAQNDFTIEEEAHPQVIKYFSKESDLPLTLGLLVDTSLSQHNVLDQERSASQSFLDQMLRPDKDKAFIIHFDYEVELLQDITNSRPLLQTALNQLNTPSFGSRSGGNNDPNDPNSNAPNSGRGQGRGRSG